jgi:hypothetical protein
MKRSISQRAGSVSARSTPLRILIDCALVFTAAVIFASNVRAAEPTREEVLAELRTYDGRSIAGVDPSTLTGKVVAGYQGWFTTETDGAELGWKHYGRRGEFRPGRCNIDLWPDVSELDDDEKFATPFRHADGDVAHVFSSHREKTVLRHFRWMQEYGLDGAMVQRFVVETTHPKTLRHFNQVLMHCRRGANEHGRCYAVMYDLSGLGPGGIDAAIEDWKSLVDGLKLGRDPGDKAYLHHRGKPLVAVWGVGFNDNRRYTLADCRRFVEFLKNDPTYGGNAVMLGVPTGWRTLDRDALANPELHSIIAEADVVSPWSVGRYDSPEAAAQTGDRVWREDVAWCAERNIDFLPVAFPGFSWHNMRPGSPSNQIPRRGGELLWSQIVAGRRAGAQMLYIAMFDELDEATAIFKCTNDPPVGESVFVAEPELPSDHYLWLTGQGARLIRGEIELDDAMPKRLP